MTSPRFRASFLHPRYWLTWFGLGVLFLLVQLPYPVLNRLGIWLGRTSMRFLKRRVSITRRNLQLCFPDLPSDQVEARIISNFESLGMGLLETGMAWFWSDARVKRWFDVSGLHNLKKAQENKQGVLVIGVHFMSLELGGRAMGLCQPMMAMYRPHNNKAMEFVQTWGRMRSNKAMLDRKDLRGMVHALKKGEAVWFAPDQDYGPRGSVFAPLFAVDQAATTSGTMVALVPTVVPTMIRVSGKTQIIKIRKGTLRRILMMIFSRCISQPGRGRTPSLSPATSRTPSGRPMTSEKAVESTVT